MRFLARLLLLVCLACPAGAGAQEMNSRYNAWIGAMIGQHFTGELNSPALFPMVEFRTGYRLGPYFSLRIDLGLAITKVTSSNRESFQGAGLMGSNCSMAFLFTPRLAENFGLNLGGSVGIWFTALWGDDLVDTQYGSESDYLEAVALNLSGMVGFDWDIDREWALNMEVRYNRALVHFAGEEYNAGGFGILLGFKYRIPAPGLI
jgi:hypothetical protein